MQVLLNTDNHIEGTERLTRYVEGVVTAAVERFGEQVTRVEVHLNDNNGQKSGQDDKRCMMEARLGGLPSIVVTHQAESIDLALNGAAERLESALERKLGRLSDRHGRTPYGGEPAI